MMDVWVLILYVCQGNPDNPVFPLLRWVAMRTGNLLSC